jgi:hypothetical protein
MEVSNLSTIDTNNVVVRVLRDGDAPSGAKTCRNSVTDPAVPLKFSSAISHEQTSRHCSYDVTEIVATNIVFRVVIRIHCGRFRT